MVQLYALHQQAVLATPSMEQFLWAETGLVQPVVATYAMVVVACVVTAASLAASKAGFVQPVCSMGNF